jgi:hypothetical protein
MKIDQYGCAVGKVMVVSLEASPQQVRAGLPWVYTDYEAELSD